MPCIREKEQGIPLSLRCLGRLRSFLLPRKQVTLSSVPLGGAGIAPCHPGPAASVLLLPGGHLLALMGPEQGHKSGHRWWHHRLSVLKETSELTSPPPIRLFRPRAEKSGLLQSRSDEWRWDTGLLTPRVRLIRAASDGRWTGQILSSGARRGTAGARTPAGGSSQARFSVRDRK